MRHYQKQKAPKKYQLTITAACFMLVIAFISIAVVDRRHTNMAQYATQNNCTWHYTGNLYGDNRDYTCK